MGLEVLLLRQQECVVADAPQVKGTLWMSVWFLLFFKKEKSAVSAAVLRRAGSGKILKFLAYCLEKVVLAHNPKYTELLKKEGLGLFTGGLCNITQRWVTWGAPWWLHSHSDTQIDSSVQCVHTSQAQNTKALQGAFWLSAGCTKEENSDKEDLLIPSFTDSTILVWLTHFFRTMQAKDKA